MKIHIDQELQVFEERCRNANLRITPQRIEIYRELALAGDHPSAEILHVRLIKKMPTLSLDTVYRSLSTFVQYGLIHKVETIESQARFEVAKTLHHHLICKNCHQILDFQWQSMDEATMPDDVEKWGRIDRKSVVAYGICRQCLEEQEQNSHHITLKGDDYE